MYQQTRGLVRALFLAAGLPLLTPAVMAQDQLLELSLEELSQLSVTSVSRRAEPVGRAAAAIAVLTGEDIRRSGAQTLPEALRLLPGIHVARLNNSSWAISARGFNSPLADKLEVLRDGRSLYSPLFSGVFWDQQDIALEDIERIELIRGPGAALWGANAVNGVLNIVTRSAAQTLGGHAQLRLGSSQTYRAEARQGFRLSNGGLRLYGHGLRMEPFVDADGEPVEAPWQHQRIGMRLDQGRLTINSEAYEGQKRTDRGELLTQGLFLLGRYEAANRTQWLGYVDGTRRALDEGFGEDRLTLHAEAQRPAQWGALQTLWGAGVKYSRDDIKQTDTLQFWPAARDLTTYSLFGQGSWQPAPDWQLTLGSKFEHNDYTGFELQPSLRGAWHPSEWTTLWAALSHAVRTPNRLDRDSRRIGAGGQAQAEGVNADLSGQTDPATGGNGPFTAQDCREAGGGTLFCDVFFGTFFPDGAPRDREQCRQAGAPGFYCDIFLNEGESRDLVGSEDFDAETLDALELGWRHTFANAVAVDLALYANRYRDLRGVDDDGEGDARIANRFDGRSHGAELVLRWNPWSRLRLQASYSWLQLDIEARAPQDQSEARSREEQDPEHQAALQAFGRIGPIESYAGLRYVDALPALDVPAYTELDLHLRWPLRNGLLLMLSGRNLLEDRHLEYATSAVRALRERSGQIGLQWQW